MRRQNGDIVAQLTLNFMISAGAAEQMLFNYHEKR
jgi:hypothetical protein